MPCTIYGTADVRLFCETLVTVISRISTAENVNHTHRPALFIWGSDGITFRRGGAFRLTDLFLFINVISMGSKIRSVLTF